MGRIAEGSLVTDTEGSETESAAEGDVASTVADDVTDADTSQADGADTESE